MANAVSRWDYEDLDWEAYRDHRPPYTDSFYKLIFDFHQQGGSGWRKAADIGCGGGVITIELSKKFEELIGADLSAYYLGEAKEYLKVNVPDFERRVTLVQTGAEDLSSIPDSSVNIITKGMMIHWIKHRKAIQENARILKSGGTMMAVIYGLFPIIIDNPEADEVFQQMNEQWWESAQAIFKENESYDEVATYLAELDSLYFDPKDWKDVHRYRWYSDVPLAYEKEFKKAKSEVGKDDVRIKDLEEGKMHRSVDVQWLKIYFENFIPHPKVLEKMRNQPWSKLDQALKGKKATMAWPAAMVLARKR